MDENTFPHVVTKEYSSSTSPNKPKHTDPHQSRLKHAKCTSKHRIVTQMRPPWPQTIQGIIHCRRSVNGLMAPKQFLNKKGGNTRPYTPLPFACDNKKTNKTEYEKKILETFSTFTLHFSFKGNCILACWRYSWCLCKGFLVVRVSAPIKETIIFEGLYRRHLYCEFEEVRQFVFECISSLINVLFPFGGSFAESFIFCVLPAFPGISLWQFSLCNWLFGIISCFICACSLWKDLFLLYSILHGIIFNLFWSTSVIVIIFFMTE